MIKTHEDLHQLVSTEIERYLAEHPEASITFEVAENNSCSMKNTQNDHKFVFLFARFGDEYKVGFALYKGYDPNPCWIDDIEHEGFDQNFMQILIKEHLIGEWIQKNRVKTPCIV